MGCDLAWNWANPLRCRPSLTAAHLSTKRNSHPSSYKLAGEDVFCMEIFGQREHTKGFVREQQAMIGAVQSD
jgi:hypothetical protein